MDSTHVFANLRQTLFVLSLSLTLGACLSEEKAADEAPDVVTENQIAGSVADGPVVGASMRVLRNDGDILDEFESDTASRFEIAVRTNGSFYPLTVEARDGIDLVTNAAPEFTLLGYVTDAGDATTANVNSFTTLTVEIARDLDGGLTAANLEAAESIAVSVFNNGLSSLKAAGPAGAQIGSGNIAEIIKASEALSETVRRTQDALQTFGYTTSANQVIRELASDAIDDVIDGLGGARVDPRTAAVSSVVAAQVLLETMANELHVNGIDAMAAMNMAIEQVNGGAPASGPADETVTPEMLSTARVGLAAAFALTNSAKVAQIQQAAGGIQTGMDAVLVRSLLPDDYRQTMAEVVMLVAGGDVADINTINGTVRSGGGELPQNRAPTIFGTPPADVVAGSDYSFTPAALDPDGDALQFGISGRPAWAAFDPATGRLSGTPGTNSVGSYAGIVISVSDGQASASLAPFTIAVTAIAPPANEPPTISGNPASQVDAGSRYSFTPSAGDPDGDALTFSIDGQPGWASFSTATGRLSGTPTNGDAGVYRDIVIGVSDGQASASLAPFTITVTAITPPANEPPTISGNPASQVDAGSPYSFTPSADDPDGDTLTFSIDGRPGWASFNTATGRLSGTPANVDAGVYPGIVIAVSDGQANASLATFTITVAAVDNNRPPTISGNPADRVNAGSPYSFTPSADDPDGDTLTFSIDGRPGWASFNTATGRLSGTPSDVNVGTYDGISITASDGSEDATLGPFSITVDAVSLGSVTLTWTPPTENDDGSPLTDLAGYRIYWGATQGNYPNSVTLNNPGLTSYVVDNLAPGTYVFVATSFNTAGYESAYSNPATKTVP